VKLPWVGLPGKAVDFFFPAWCLGCGQEGTLLCPSCRSGLPRLLPPLCPRCGEPQALEPCPFCRGRQLSIDSIRSPYRFEGLIRRALIPFKYHNLRVLAAPLARLMYDYLASHPFPADAVAPVPLHPSRQRRRGYNQASLLALELGRLAGLPVVETSLRRTRPTPLQAQVTGREERRRNVLGAFLSRDQSLKGKGVLLVDDICTTGATLDAAAQALKAGGAHSVWGLTVAREV